MVSIFTPNVGLEEPARGDYVGTWDTPVNNNSVVLDLTIGGRTAISLNNSPVILGSAQYQCAVITFNSTLTGSCLITFPTSFTKPYKIRNLCTGSSAFVVTLVTSAAGNQIICAPPGETIDVFNDGTSLYYCDLDRVGAYWDYAGSSVPLWVTTCSVPPYLACTGGTFSSATYPQLATVLGSTTLPDARGRARFDLDGGAGRISSAATGFSGSSVGSGGGGQTTTLSSANIPPVPITDPGHSHNAIQATQSRNDGTSVLSLFAFAASSPTSTSFTGITAGSSSPTAFTNLPPAFIGGITMIRAG